VLVALLGLALLIFVIGQFASLRSLAAGLASADWRWAVVALAIQLAVLLLYGGLYHLGFRSVGVASRPLQLVPVLLASIFVKTVLPLTAAPAAAVFIDDAAARGQSGTRAAVGVVVVLVVDLITALPFVLAGGVALVISSRLVGFAVAGTAVFVGLLVALLVALGLAAIRPQLLEMVLRAGVGLLDRVARMIGRPAPLPETWVDRTTGQLSEAARSVPGHLPDLLVASGYGLAIHVLSLVGLAALFLTFGWPLTGAALLAGFGMGIVFFVVSIAPDGIGAVEGAMALVFVQLGVAPPAAILVTLSYRALSVWLPVGLGAWYARRLRIFSERALVGAASDALDVSPDTSALGGIEASAEP
jgi:uncharacterized protein (TIRG00374 family)